METLPQQNIDNLIYSANDNRKEIDILVSKIKIHYDYSTCMNVYAR